ncbi:MAG: hypothetical protein IT384_27015 [Deltaproteobacteria bacterium]|nr:hypothetical protein [Deltaproteobacteria bacterium]
MTAMGLASASASACVDTRPTASDGSLSVDASDSALSDGGHSDTGLAPIDAMSPADAAAQDSGAPDGGMAVLDGTAPMDAQGPPIDAGPFDGGSINALTARFERPTPEQIGLHLIVNRTLAEPSRVTVRYKELTEQTWRIGHPLLRIQPQWIAGGAPEAPVDSFGGTIFDLRPATTYDLEITLSEPGMPDQSFSERRATRALPPAAPAVTARATPADDLQARLDALGPGSVLELGDGTYDVSGLFLASSGTEAQPIYIRGQSRGGVVLRNAGRVLQIQAASHVVIEDLTMEGSGVDSGTNASSVGISFWDGALQEDITFRNLDIRGVDMGIVASGTTRSVLVYNCTLRGNNVWNATSIESNLTWNDDGIRLPGEGNCAFENTLHGFGDSFAVNNGVHSAGVYYYRNRITMTGDDAFEADYGTRNLAFYDNAITNSATFLSLDPLWGGPLYCFRNVSINTMRGPFKLNNTNSGFLVYSNTIVRTEGTTTWGWVQYNNGDLRGWAFRNNILIYRGGTGNLLAIESSANDPIDFTHNAWFPDGDVWWSSSGGSFGSIAAARAGLPATAPLFGSSTARHDGDVITASDPFTSPVTLGADHLVEFTAEVTPALAAGAAPKNSGVAIPNVTDGYTGAAPDMGAIIEGRSQPRRGAIRP